VKIVNTMKKTKLVAFIVSFIKRISFLKYYAQDMRRKKNEWRN
jgi:hypothetical protein